MYNELVNSQKTFVLSLMKVCFSLMHLRAAAHLRIPLQRQR